MTKELYKEKQKQKQEELDKQKWEASQESGKDLSGEMEYCEGCASHIFGTFCRKTQAEREQGCLCARAFNNMKRRKKK